MKEKILHWFATGRVGASSKAMACCFAGIDGDEKNHPYDPDDLSRCLKFLDAVPEARTHMDKLRSISPQWSKLVDHWAELEETYRAEFAEGWRNRPRNGHPTWDLMQRIFAEG
jgi:hypothetical protein